MNASDIAAREFPVVRKGYDPAEVRAFLAQIGASGFVGDIDASEIEATARAYAERVIEQAESTAAAQRAEADIYTHTKHAAADAALAEAQHAYAEGVAAAKARADEALAQAEQVMSEADQKAAALLADAEAQATARLEAAEAHARERSAAILDDAKQQLQRLLDAEAEVHVRLTAAFANINSPDTHPIDREHEQLLDLAFAEFFTSDVEHDESRAWILSEQAG